MFKAVIPSSLCSSVTFFWICMHMHFFWTTANSTAGVNRHTSVEELDSGTFSVFSLSFPHLSLEKCRWTGMLSETLHKMLGCTPTMFCLQSLLHSRFQGGITGEGNPKFGNCYIWSFELFWLTPPKDKCFAKLCLSLHWLTLTTPYVDKALSPLQK